MRRNAKLFLLLLVLSALVLMFVPWKTTVVSAVRLQILDETGKPAAGVRVEQEWQFQGVDPESQRATSVTDSNGFVAFPARAVKISAVRRAPAYAKSLLPLMCAYSYGPFGAIWAYGPDPRAYDVVVCDVNNQHPRPLKLTRWDLVSH